MVFLDNAQILRINISYRTDPYCTYKEAIMSLYICIYSLTALRLTTLFLQNGASKVAIKHSSPFELINNFGVFLQ